MTIEQNELQYQSQCDVPVVHVHVHAWANQQHIQCVIISRRHLHCGEKIEADRFGPSATASEGIVTGRATVMNHS